MILADAFHLSTFPDAFRFMKSPLPEARVSPSLANMTEVTASLCPLRVARSCPVATSHSFTVLS